MALETAYKFLERMEREDSLRTQLYITRPEDLNELTTFAQGKGFKMSKHDLAQAIEGYQERFATGSIAPLHDYLKGYKRLPQPSTDEE